MMKIAVIGTGYVGSVTGACFAELGNEVVCIDIDKKKIDKMRRGIVPIFEPGLDELFNNNIENNRLSFSDKLHDVAEAEVIFLALPTPSNENGSADLSYILDVAEQLGEILKHYTVIVDKSTVPVGTASRVSNIISKNTKKSFDVVSNPEFLREGQAINDFFNPDRIVIGSNSKKATEIMKDLYKPLIIQLNTKIILTDPASAEMIKYAANSFLATKISFINQISGFCELVGADIEKVKQGIGADSRIGDKFLNPGPGFGGSCFPKDVSALIHMADSEKHELSILKSVFSVNTSQKGIIGKKVVNFFKKNIKGRVIAVWGLAFKDNTDDIRQSPALTIIRDLLTQGASIVAYDPQAIKNTQVYFSSGEAISYSTDQYEALLGCDALVIATEWSNFMSPNFGKIKQNLNNNVIFDGRNLYDLDEMKKHGFHYESIGRRIVK